MSSRLVVLAAVVVALAGITAALIRVAAVGSGHAAARVSLPSSPGSYLGVYAAGTPDTYRGVTAFADAIGRQPNLVGYYSGWGEEFKTSFAQDARAHGAVPLVQIDPTYASIKDIAAGAYDHYLRTYASSVRKFGAPVVLGFGHEMNARWYPWGYGHVPPRTFVVAWRHIVVLFRRAGASNVTWLWTVNADLGTTGPLAAWWPGEAYVTWVGIDGYYYRRGDTFDSVFGRTIAQVREFAHKPVLLSETAAGQRAGQAAKVPDLFRGCRQYGTLGLVWFDIRQHHGIYHQDWHIDGHPRAAALFRRLVARLLLVPL
jgi:Glycosyl hydrolase family 26